MKRFVPLFALFILCLAALPSHAENSQIIPRGTVQTGKAKTLPPATGEQIDEALKASQDCKANDYLSSFLDCDCLGMSLLDIRRQKGPDIPLESILPEARRMCPNVAAAAGRIYQTCLKWAPRRIGSNYQDFCYCYGTEYGALYEKNPSSNLNVREAQMTKALGKCQLGKVTLEQAERTSWLKKLKESGLYKSLFPAGDPLLDDPGNVAK